MFSGSGTFTNLVALAALPWAGQLSADGLKLLIATKVLYDCGHKPCRSGNTCGSCKFLEIESLPHNAVIRWDYCTAFEGTPTFSRIFRITPKPSKSAPTIAKIVTNGPFIGSFLELEYLFRMWDEPKSLVNLK